MYVAHRRTGHRLPSSPRCTLATTRRSCTSTCQPCQDDLVAHTSFTATVVMPTPVAHHPIPPLIYKYKTTPGRVHLPFFRCMPSRIEAQSYPYLLVPPPSHTPIVPEYSHYNHTVVNIPQPARIPSPTFEMPSYHNRSKTHSAGVVASTGLLLAQGASAAVFNAADNVAVYWGQNSYNQGSGELAQQSLADYCAK